MKASLLQQSLLRALQEEPAMKDRDVRVSVEPPSRETCLVIHVYFVGGLQPEARPLMRLVDSTIDRLLANKVEEFEVSYIIRQF